MYRIFLTLIATIVLTSCAMGPQGQWVAPNRPDVNRVQDHVECLALASHGAQGHGAFFSSRIMREGMYNDAKQELYNLCVQGRGYSFQVTR